MGGSGNGSPPLPPIAYSPYTAVKSIYRIQLNKKVLVLQYKTKLGCFVIVNTVVNTALSNNFPARHEASLNADPMYYTGQTTRQPYLTRQH